MLISLGAALAVAAGVVWAPAPSGWVEDDAPAASASQPAPSPITSPQSVQASAAAAHIQFAPQAVTPVGPLDSAAAQPPRPAPGPPGPPVLVGLADGSPHRFAYVLNDGQTTRAGLWDKVGKWRVTAIGPHGITLSSGRQTLALALYGPRLPPPLPPDAAVGGSPPTPPAETAPAPAPPRAHALEPASAPSPRGASGHGPHYWVGPADRAPPGYVVLQPGQVPP